MSEAAVLDAPPATAAPPPSAPAAPRSTPTGKPTESSNDAYADLDAMSDPPPEPRPGAKAETEKPGDRTPPKAADKLPETNGDIEPSKMAPKALREAYEALKAK